MTQANETPWQGKFQTRLHELLEVNDELSKSQSFDDLYRRVVELGRARLGFERASLWMFDSDPRYAFATFGTDESGQTRDERGYRIRADFSDQLQELFHSRSIRALRYDTALYNNHSQIIGHGEAAVTFIWDGDQRLGYLVIDNYLRRQPILDDGVELLGLYGAIIGHQIARLRSEIRLRSSQEMTHRFQERLKSLHEVTGELAITRSFDEFCRRAVELGRSKLGFERLGLWFYDPKDSNFFIGSFGTDEQGRTRDERRQRVSSDMSNMALVQYGRAYVSTTPDAPLYNEHQETIGHGWKASAQVWDGQRCIGWLSTDNLFSQRPGNDYDVELLVLYADTLGHLTSARQFEEALEAERNLLRTIIDTVPDQIFVKDMAGRYTLVNRASLDFALRLGMRETTMIGKTDFELFPSRLAKTYTDEDRRVAETGLGMVNFEAAVDLADGSQAANLTTKIPLHDQHGSLTGIVGITRNIDTLKEAEYAAQELALARERVRLLQEFISSVSHDLRTPLTVIISSLYLLERYTDPEKQKSQIDKIKHQAWVLERFIEDILTSSRLENISQIERSPLQLNTLVSQLETQIHSALTAKGLSLNVQPQPDLPLVLADDSKLYRALSNLAQNAIAYTPEGGSITIRTFADDGQVVFEIADTGIGIAEEDKPRIFDHFYRADKARTADTAGTGLGLAIVQRVVKMHEGSIQVESEPGEGSTFRVLIPAFFEQE